MNPLLNRGFTRQTTRNFGLEYVLMMFEGAVHLCGRCKPQSDPDGFGMHAEYAAKMRAHLAEVRAEPDPISERCCQ